MDEVGHRPQLVGAVALGEVEKILRSQAHSFATGQGDVVAGLAAEGIDPDAIDAALVGGVASDDAVALDDLQLGGAGLVLGHDVAKVAIDIDSAAIVQQQFVHRLVGHEADGAGAGEVVGVVEFADRPWRARLKAGANGEASHEIDASLEHGDVDVGPPGQRHGARAVKGGEGVL